MKSGLPSDPRPSWTKPLRLRKLLYGLPLFDPRSPWADLRQPVMNKKQNGGNMGNVLGEKPRLIWKRSSLGRLWELEWCPGAPEFREEVPFRRAWVPCLTRHRVAHECAACCRGTCEILRSLHPTNLINANKQLLLSELVYRKPIVKPFFQFRVYMSETWWIQIKHINHILLSEAVRHQPCVDFQYLA